MKYWFIVQYLILVFNDKELNMYILHYIKRTFIHIIGALFHYNLV